MTRREGQPEEVEVEQHDGLRGQTTPPPGTRPGVPQDPGPPVVGAVTVGYVAAPGPLLAPPVLAGDDGLDESALAFLVQQTLLAREKEEAEAVEAAELAELAANLARTEERIVEEIDRLRVLRDRSDLTQLWNRCCRWYLQRAAVKKLKEKRKKKKKKRKKKLPKSSSFPRLSRCSSRCVPSCCRLQACDARYHGRFGPEVQLRRHWWHAWLVLLLTLHLALCFLPCLLARDARHHGRYEPEGILRVAVQKSVDFRSRSSSQVVDFLLRCRGLFPWSCCSADHRVFQLPRYMWSTSLLCRSCRFSGGLQFSDTLTTCPLLSTTGAWSWTVSKIAEVPQLQFFNGRRFPRRGA